MLLDAASCFLLIWVLDSGEALAAASGCKDGGGLPRLEGGWEQAEGRGGGRGLGCFWRTLGCFGRTLPTLPRVLVVAVLDSMVDVWRFRIRFEPYGISDWIGGLGMGSVQGKRSG